MDLAAASIFVRRRDFCRLLGSGPINPEGLNDRIEPGSTDAARCPNDREVHIAAIASEETAQSLPSLPRPVAFGW